MAFTDYLRDLAPPWLRGLWGARWWSALGAEIDDAASRVKEGVLARFVLHAPTDALPYLGRDRALERLPGELDADYRARLDAGWETWPRAGTLTGVRTGLLQLSFSDFEIIPASGWPGGPPGGHPERWARFWVVLFDHPWSLDHWDDPGTWDDGGTWDTSATAEEIALVTGVVRKWKNARDLAWVWLVFGDGDLWGPWEPWDNGTWSDEGASLVVAWKV